MDPTCIGNSTNVPLGAGSTNTQFPLTPAAVALPILALITLVIDLPPFIWHVRNRNLAAATLVFYILLANLMNLVNPLIWPTDDIGDWWPGFGLCDLEVKLMLGIWIGVVSCLLCIVRNLARVLNTDRTVMSVTRAQRNRQILFDCLLCFGAPVYMMGIHYIVQSNRYYIFAISGCTASFDESWPSLVLIFIWSPILCIFNLYYAGMISFFIIVVTLFLHARYPQPPINFSKSSNPDENQLMSCLPNSPSHHPHAPLSHQLLCYFGLLIQQSYQKSLHASVLDGIHPHPRYLPCGMPGPLQERREQSFPLLLVPHSRATGMDSRYDSHSRFSLLRPLDPGRGWHPCLRLLRHGPGCQERL